MKMYKTTKLNGVLVKNTILALLALLTLSKAYSMEAPATPLRIMTFNIRRQGKEKEPNNLWENRKARVEQLIRDQHPDIMGLQEPTKEQIGDLAQALKQYAWFGTGRGSSWLGMGTDEYNPIFYNTQRFELQPEHGTFSINQSGKFEYAWDYKKYGLLPRICTWAKFKDKKTNHEFYVYNTHLDHLYPQAQRHGLTTILNFMTKQNKQLPVILMGDFNTELTAELQDTLLKDFSDTKLRTLFRVGPEETRTGWHHEELKKIDHILLSNNADAMIVQHITVAEPNKDELPSDHRPVMIDLSF